jgi:hypothetical protein
MKDKAKPVDALTIADLQTYPVWQYTSSDDPDETYVRPLKRVPVAKLDGKLIGTEVTLANGQQAWAIIGNVDPMKPRRTQHFITLSIERRGEWFHLARYHDYDAKTRGPKALAEFLNLPVDEVFPISYDIQRYGKGDPAALCGEIPKKPQERLSRSEVIGLIFQEE